MYREIVVLRLCFVFLERVCGLGVGEWSIVVPVPGVAYRGLPPSDQEKHPTGCFKSQLIITPC